MAVAFVNCIGLTHTILCRCSEFCAVYTTCCRLHPCISPYILMTIDTLPFFKNHLCYFCRVFLLFNYIMIKLLLNLLIYKNLNLYYFKNHLILHGEICMQVCTYSCSPVCTIYTSLFAAVATAQKNTEKNQHSSNINT